MAGETGAAPNHNRLLAMLLLAYAVNFMDRTVVATLAQPIKLDLKITDAQLGLLQGFAFVVLYSVMGVPIARWCERYNRVTIMSVCIAAWSAMTMLCGTAANFGQLLLFRIGVGVGEAGCNAPSHSMIADAFPAKRRASAVSIYNFGTSLGTMIGAMSGGVMAQYLGWRVAFVVVGAPGLLLALALRLFVREPARVAEAPAVGVGRVSAGRVARLLAGNPATRHLILGFTLVSFGVAGTGAFAQPYFIRAFGLTVAQIGLIFGFFSGLAGGTSIVTGGRLADWAVARDVRWHAWLPALGIALSLPFSMGTYLVGSWPVALGLLMAGALMVYWFIAPTLSAVHKIVGARSVAMAMALLLLFQNLLGLGAGPFFTGKLIDLLAAHNFAAKGLGAFLTTCPGGAAPAGAPATLAAACHASLVQATRAGILITFGAKAWAVIHFLLAARHIPAALPATTDAPTPADELPAAGPAPDPRAPIPG